MLLESSSLSTKASYLKLPFNKSSSSGSLLVEFGDLMGPGAKPPASENAILLLESGKTVEGGTIGSGLRVEPGLVDADRML